MQMKWPLLCAAALGFACLAAPANAPLAAEILQTQMGTSGETEVDILKAQVSNNVLTIVAQFRNTTNRKLRRRFPISDIYYVDAAGQKKYQVLMDANNRWLAAPLAQDNAAWMYFDIAANGKRLIWMKFPAPTGDATSINLTLPVALPFDNLPISR